MMKYPQVIIATVSILLGGMSTFVQGRIGNDQNRIFASSSSVQAGAAILTRDTFFTEDFETGFENWTASYLASNGSFTVRNWTLVNSESVGHSGTAAFGVSPSGGECGVVLENGIISLASPAVTIADGPNSNYYVAFDHYFALEGGLDGGNMKYRINGEAWKFVPATAIGINPYNAVLLATEAGNNNPMAGQSAFSGSGSGWQRTTFNLSVLGVKKGDTVEVRWDVGTDTCGGIDGWYIDNVEIYGVEIPIPPTPPKKPLVHFEKSDEAISEAGIGTSGTVPDECLKFTDHKIKVIMDTVASGPVTVLVHTLDFQQENTNYATEGARMDYQIISGKIVLQEGDLSKEVTVRIFDDGQEEKDELIQLAFSLITDGDAEEVAPSIFNLLIVDDDRDKRVLEEELFSETFKTASIPIGWVTEGATDDAIWGVSPFGDSPQPGNYGLRMHYVGSREYRVEFERYIDTPVFNSSDYSELTINFDHILYFDLDSNSPTAEVEIWTGTSWVSVWQINNSTQDYPIASTHVDVPIPAQYGNSEMKVRFRFFTYHTGNWQIDNISIKGTKYIPSIQNQISVSPGQQYLGSNQTVYFYDPETKSILAKIKNLTDHDYGCTSVEIDRAGEGTSEWKGYNISDKTFRVIPSHPDPAGKYEITLFYTAAELGEFASSIISMGKSEGGIGVGDASSSTAVPVSVAKYNEDYAFTATFDTGFSGFGLSDAPPGTSLPVKLLSFEGKNTGEGNMLHWVTTEEINNDYFAVERSSDAKRFAEISRIQALTILSNSNNYYFTDANITSEKSYYRLKQVDKDGKYTYSGMVVIQNGMESNLIVYPNPTRGPVKFRIDTNENGLAELEVINLTGRVMLKVNGIQLKDGYVEQDINKLSPNVYQAVITTNKRKYQYKIVKQ